ncbi:MAG: TetR family transcriptional regulator C-terminal domain-containing protein [Candidatus Xenobia bacterium]
MRETCRQTRALRDPHLSAILAGMDRTWHAHLSRVRQHGVERGCFRADLDVALTASCLMVTLSGLGQQPRRPPGQLRPLVRALGRTVNVGMTLTR